MERAISASFGDVALVVVRWKLVVVHGYDSHTEFLVSAAAAGL